MPCFLEFDFFAHAHYFEITCYSHLVRMISIRRKISGGSPAGRQVKSGFLALSKKVDYGLFFMAHLAMVSPGADVRSVSLMEIAKEHGLSFYFLQKVALDLRKAGLILSSRGKEGGYKLAKPAFVINIKDIVEALEGPVALLECMNVNALSSCSRQADCFVRNGLSSMNKKIIDTLSEFTLYELISKKC